MDSVNVLLDSFLNAALLGVTNPRKCVKTNKTKTPPKLFRGLLNDVYNDIQVILDDMAKRASSTPGKRQKASDASSPSGGDKNDGSDNTGIPKSVDDLPSKEEMLKLDEELVQLRNKLRATKRVGHNLKLANMRLQRLIEMASKSSEGVAAAINAGESHLYFHYNISSF